MIETIVKIVGLFLAGVGALVVLGKGLDVLVKYVPYLGRAKVAIWKFLSENLKVRRFKRKAIAAGIEFAVNRAVQDLQDELPSGWINWARIDWVRGVSTSELQDKELILRIRPDSDEDRNYLNAVYYFFATSLFPSTQRLLPSNIKIAVPLYLTKRTMEANAPFLQGRFEKELLEQREDEDSSIAGYLGDFVKIDQFGFFNSVFIRETDTLAEFLRFTHERENLEPEIRIIIDHLKKFQNISEKRPLAAREWYRTLKATSYGFILLARPDKIQTGTARYVQRAKQRWRLGIRRLYVLGRQDEKQFFADVLSHINAMTPYTVVETFKLHRDYRQHPNGIGALCLADEKKLLKSPDLALLLPPPEKNGRHRPTPKKPPIEESKILPSISNLQTQIREISWRIGDKDGWVLFSRLGLAIRNQNSLFNVQHYGYRTFTELVRNLDGFEMDLRDNGMEALRSTIPAPLANVPEQIYVQPLTAPNNSAEMIRYLKSVVHGYADDAGWADLRKVRERLEQDFPELQPVAFGCRSLREFVEKSGSFSVEQEGSRVFILIR
ncbi:MAG: OST-HTH/LOTUS domain-containing protein [Acidobacteriota bacterium]